MFWNIPLFSISLKRKSNDTEKKKKGKARWFLHSKTSSQACTVLTVRRWALLAHFAFSSSWWRKVLLRLQFWKNLRFKKKWEGPEGSLLGQQLIMQRAVIGASEGPTMQSQSFVMEGDVGSPWAAYLGSQCQFCWGQWGGLNLLP